MSPPPEGRDLRTRDFAFVVGEAEEGERLDRLLAAREPLHSRSEYQRWIKEGRVRLGGAPATAKSRPRAGERVEVEPAPPPPSELTPEPMALAILHEDADLLVLDKPPGLVVHPGAGHATGTLVHGLLAHVGGLPGEDPSRAGIVHRLDRWTSGVMVVAKSARALKGLSALFAEHAIERAYLAIATGRPPERARYQTLHGRHPVDRKRFSSKVKKGKPALTEVERLELLHASALVRCRLHTGRTHQIRVHLADAGFPLLGDPLYGGRIRDPRLKAAGEALGRQALHAAVLGFEHPVSGEKLRFETEPPEDLRAAIEALRAGAP